MAVKLVPINAAPEGSVPVNSFFVNTTGAVPSGRLPIGPTEGHIPYQSFVPYEPNPIDLENRKCSAHTKSGGQCKKDAWEDSVMCYSHWRSVAALVAHGLSNSLLGNPAKVDDQEAA